MTSWGFMAGIISLQASDSPDSSLYCEANHVLAASHVARRTAMRVVFLFLPNSQQETE